MFLANYTFCHSIEAEEGFEFIYHGQDQEDQMDELIAVVVSASKVNVKLPFDTNFQQRYFPE